MAATYTTVTHDQGEDDVAVEEPLEIRVDGRALAVTMRTPGHDEELALGFLYGEGLIDGPRAAGPTHDFAANIVEIDGPLLHDPGTRRFYTTSSCGVCGKGALEEVAVHAQPLDQGPVVARSLVASCPTCWSSPPSSAREAFTPPGCLTGAGRCSSNARTWVDTTRWTRSSGRALLDGLVPLRERILCVSGRLSFELVQKAAVAGAPILVGVGAPSSLAISLARTVG